MGNPAAVSTVVCMLEREWSHQGTGRGLGQDGFRKEVQEPDLAMFEVTLSKLL